MGEVKFFQLAIDNLLLKGAIEQCKPSKDQFLSSYFLVPKPDGSHRFILNLKKLNEFIETDHFKIEDIRTAKRLVFPGFFMCSIDLEDAYYLIPIHKCSKRFLRFEFEGKLFQFSCLPFGLNVSPYVFTKVLKPVMNYLRLRGLSSVIYLDDILCIGKDFEDCKSNLRLTIELFNFLGFIINFKKSNLIPSTRCKYLGLIIDTKMFAIVLPKEKKISLIKAIRDFMHRRYCTIEEMARLIGRLIAACPAVEYGMLYTRVLEREKILALRANNFNFNGKLLIKESVRVDLKWWIENLTDAKNLINKEDFSKEIYTDASNTGWGATDGIKKIYGFWNKDEILFHINYKELLAVKFALEFLAENLYNCKILLRVDNTTAISYINKMGGVRFTYFNMLAKEIWQWAEKRKIFLVASYIPSIENVEADRLSRVRNEDIEWELNQRYFELIEKRFGNINIDLFASNLNAKCANYVSWKPDPAALQIDAFTIKWTNLKFYAFPPFNLVLKTLGKINQDKVSGIIVVPYWPGQAWFPLFIDMLIEEPLIFEPKPNLLLSACRKKFHPRADHLYLMAGRVSARHF